MFMLSRVLFLILNSVGVDIVLVKKSVRQLLYYRCVVMVDLFQFSNVYVPSPKLNAVLCDPQMISSCYAYVMTPEIITPSLSPSPPPSLAGEILSIQPHVLLGFYAQLQRNVTTGEFLLRNRFVEHGIDIRRFVTFGLINGLIQRIHAFPRSLTSPPSAVHIAIFADGSNSQSDDALCCKFDLPFSKIETLFAQDASIVMVRK